VNTVSLSIFRVSLEPLAHKHRDDIGRLLAELALATANPWQENMKPAEYVNNAIQNRCAGTQYSFAVLADTRVVGVSSLRAIDDGSKTAQCGFWIGPAFQGYATLSVRKLLQFGFESLRLESVNALTLSQNAAARRVLHNVGFIQQARLNCTGPSGCRIECCYFRITNPGRRDEDASDQVGSAQNPEPLL
jgi:RimJ/RimL family protein N-acetyltransferase